MSDSLPLSFQHNATELRVACGDDSLVALARDLKRQGCRRAIVLSGKTVSRSAAMDMLREALADALVGESQTVQTNSPLRAVEEAARILGELDADAVIAVGGGSAVVTARAASILLAEKKPAVELCTRRLPDGTFESPRLNAAKLPLFVVPTTPSNAFVKAGSAVHDADTGQRLALFDPKTRAKALFIHPAFIATSPTALFQSAALNTLSTAVEALESPRCDPLSEAQLMHAVRLTAQHLNRLAPEDLAAREHLVIAAILCGRGTEQSGGGLASVLAHAIGHRAHVANGLVNAVVLPHTMRFNAPATQHTAARIGDSLRHAAAPNDATASDSPTRAADALDSLLATLSLSRRLRDIGVTRDDLDPIAEAALSDYFISRGPRPVSSKAELVAILEAAW